MFFGFCCGNIKNMVQVADKTKNVHRIVVGSDGTYYYSNNHFYRVGVLPKETINKMFGGIK